MVDAHSTDEFIEVVDIYNGRCLSNTTSSDGVVDRVNGYEIDTNIQTASFPIELSVYVLSGRPSGTRAHCFVTGSRNSSCIWVHSRLTTSAL